MTRVARSAVIFAMLIAGSAIAEDDAVEKKLASAKAEYGKAVEKLRDGLHADMKKKADAAQRAGDLMTLEKVESEIKAFDEKGELPKSVSTKGFEAELRRIKARMEDAYVTTVKESTKAGKREEAKAIQKELEEFKKSDGFHSAPIGPFQAKSIWISDPPGMTLTVSERRGGGVPGAVGGWQSRAGSGRHRQGRQGFLARKGCPQHQRQW